MALELLPPEPDAVRAIAVTAVLKDGTWSLHVSYDLVQVSPWEARTLLEEAAELVVDESFGIDQEDYDERD